MSRYRINSQGARINPNLRPSEDIYLQAAKHREQLAKRQNLAQNIQDVLDN